MGVLSNCFLGKENRSKAEQLGQFPLILSTWNEKHWMKPELIEQSELLQVKLILTVSIG